jgi:alkylated DNA repair protein alkB family protein 6
MMQTLFGIATAQLPPNYWVFFSVKLVFDTFLPMIEDLDQYKLLKTNSVYFIPSFINEPYAESLLHRVSSASSLKWTTLQNRRLQLWGCQHLKDWKNDWGSASKLMIDEGLPDWLSSLASKIEDRVGERGRFNQVLVNEYCPGQGILPHTGMYRSFLT